MNVVVFGAGAVGTLFGARLAAAGHAVTLVARADHVAAVRARGVVVEGVRPGRYWLGATEQLELGTPVEAVLLGVKTFDLALAVREVAGALPGPVPVLAPQNGLGLEEAIANGLRGGGWTRPLDWVVRMVHSVPATLVAPGVVRQAGDGEILLPAPATPPVPAVELWAMLLATMGYPVRRLPAFEREVWRKALLNAAINPVTADHGILNGRLREDPYRGQALELLHEAQRVAEAEGFPFGTEELERDLWRVVLATAPNRSSMLQDVDRGRRTEVEAISGQILAIADRHHFALPATRRAVRRILDRPRRQGSADHRASRPAQPS